jgi:hypothetical protein
MANLPHLPVKQQHLHDVEAQFHLRVFQQAQVIQCVACEPTSPIRIHGRGRPRPLFRRTRFDLYEYEAIRVAEDQIGFATRRAEIGGEELQAEPPQMFSGRALAEFAEAQMPRLFGPAPQRFDALGESHITRIALIPFAPPSITPASGTQMNL